MRILLIIGNLEAGGAQRVVSTLSNNFIERGYSVAIATNMSKRIQFTIDKKVELYNIYDKSENYFLRKYFLIKNIRNKIYSFKPNFVISHIRQINIYSIIASIGIKTKVICCEHTSIQRKHGAIEEIFKKIFYQFADSITVLTRSDLKFIESKKNYIRMPNPVIPNKSHYQFNNRENIILFAGRVDAIHNKGLDLLMNIWEKVSPEFPDWKLHLIGPYSKDSFKYLYSLLSEKVKKSVFFLGHKVNVTDYMKNSKVYISTSRVEGFPMVLSEALSNKMCCLSFDCVTGPNELIKNRVSGVLVPAEDKRRMIKELKIILGDINLQTYYSENSHIKLKNFYVKKVMNRWDILFKKLL